MHPIGQRCRRRDLNLESKRAVYRSYVLANGSLYHLTGRMAPFPSSGRYETFQTDRSIARELRRAGFGEIQTTQGYHYVVTATKRPAYGIL